MQNFEEPFHSVTCRKACEIVNILHIAAGIH